MNTSDRQIYKLSYKGLIADSIGLVATIVGFIFVSSMLGLAENVVGDSSIGNTILDALGSNQPIMVILFALVVPSAVMLISKLIHFKFYSYELADDELCIRYGLISKKSIHIPYQRIQSVNEQAKLLMRLLGVSSLKIDTAGGSSNSANDIPSVTNAQAAFLKEELFRRKKIALEKQANPTEISGGGDLGNTCNIRPQEKTQAKTQENHNIFDAPASAVQEVLDGFYGENPCSIAASFELGATNKEIFLSALASTITGIIFSLCLIIFPLLTTSAPLIFNAGAPIEQMLLSAIIPIIVGGVGTLSLVIWIATFVSKITSF